MSKEKTASFIIIGNEILSGRTADKNLNFLANELTELGINLKEVRVVRDEEDQIIKTVKDLHDKHDYIFTSGGIGATHDDITIASIAKAFDTKLTEDSQIKEILTQHYKERINKNILKMALIPEGAIPLNNHMSSVPGFKFKNIFVLAGIPRIMQAMFAASKEHLEHGIKVNSISVTSYATEGRIAGYLEQLQNNYPEIEIGSYPFKQDDKYATSVVFRGTDLDILKEASKEYNKYLVENKIDLISN